MTISGIVQNGVVVLEGGTALPDGTPVTVLVEQRQSAPLCPQNERMSEEERQRVLAILDRISSLPDENPGDTFSGADHDKVLYGMP
jgi:hypothetical protein